MNSSVGVHRFRPRPSLSGSVRPLSGSLRELCTRFAPASCGGPQADGFKERIEVSDDALIETELVDRAIRLTGQAFRRGCTRRGAAFLMSFDSRKTRSARRICSENGMPSRSRNASIPRSRSSSGLNVTTRSVGMKC